MSELRDLSGSKLYNLAMNLPVDVRVDVFYTSTRAAMSAASGASTKRLVEGTGNVIGIKRWTDFTGRAVVTVGRIGTVITTPSILTTVELSEIDRYADKRAIKAMYEDGFSTIDIHEMLDSPAWSLEMVSAEVEGLKEAGGRE